MKGHETLIQLRKAGKTPKIVFVNDFPCKTDWFDWWDHATVCVADDGVETIDFRFAHGITMSILALNKTRAKALFELGKASGAIVVACGSADGFNEIWRA
jgi:hypothetical protein